MEIFFIIFLILLMFQIFQVIVDLISLGFVLLVTLGSGVIYFRVMHSRLLRVAAECHVPADKVGGMTGLILVGAVCAGIGSLLVPQLMLFGTGLYLVIRVMSDLVWVLRRSRF